MIFPAFLDEPLIDDIHTATATSTTTTSAPQNTAAAAEIPVAAPPDATMTRCVRCICLSTSACDASVCDPTAALCNLWEINYTEWRDAGAPVLPDREYPNPISAFEHCRSDEGCATETIVRYFDVTKAVGFVFVQWEGNKRESEIDYNSVLSVPGLQRRWHPRLPRCVHPACGRTGRM